MTRTIFTLNPLQTPAPPAPRLPQPRAKEQSGESAPTIKKLPDKAVIDNAAVDEILAPYQAESGAPAEAEPAAPVDSAATGSN